MPKVIQTENSIILDITDQWENFSGEYADIELEAGTLERFQEAFPDATLEEIALMIAEAIKRAVKERCDE